jgi:hypothetical protein
MEQQASARRDGDALARMSAALGVIGQGKGPPPVERWRPAYCGEIDLRIAADGTWWYNGTPIARPALVKLFASILRKDPDRYVLVTPVECVGIMVEDAPFLAVEMTIDGDGEGRRIAFRTNVDDVVLIGRNHPLRFERESSGGLKPYVLVRGDLWARVNRALVFDLIELGEDRDFGGDIMFGVFADHQFFAIAPRSELAGFS